MTVHISGIIEESIVDGDGIRYVIFTQGCPHNCIGCHNRGTHSFEHTDGEFINSSQLISQISTLNSIKLLSGVTLSGGEPFVQSEALYPIALEAKRLGFNVWCYTGYTLEELLSMSDASVHDLLSVVDILVDGRFDITKRDLTLKFRGSSNQRIIDMNVFRNSNKIETLY